MEELLINLSKCIEYGKINYTSPYPSQLQGQLGACELTEKALSRGIDPQEILEMVLIPTMKYIGEKYVESRIFVPQMLMSANAMKASMERLKSYFNQGSILYKGIFIIGTVSGDLHDIGKNLVAMMVEGAGWRVIDLGVDVPADKYISTLDSYPDAVCGMSALLTTTMINMELMIAEIREKYPLVKIVVGGAPLNAEFARKIGANAYAKDPQDNINWLNSLIG